MEKYLCWFVYREPYVPYETMLERMIGSTFNSSNVHRVVDDNNDYYKSIVMAVMRMNQGDTNKCSIIDEEPNKDTTRFFDLLKDSDNHYRMSAQILVNYWSLHNYSLSSQIMD